MWHSPEWTSGKSSISFFFLVHDPIRDNLWSKSGTRHPRGPSGGGGGEVCVSTISESSIRLHAHQCGDILQERSLRQPGDLIEIPSGIKSLQVRDEVLLRGLTIKRPLERKSEVQLRKNKESNLGDGKGSQQQQEQAEKRRTNP